MRRLAAVALVGVALLPLLPVLAALWSGFSLPARFFALWFELHCERDPARTLVLAGVPLAVCARCSGIYFGLGLGALLRQPRLSPRALRIWVLLAAALMIGDVALETRGLHGSWTMLRVLTGLLLAYPVGVGLALLTERAPAGIQRP